MSISLSGIVIQPYFYPHRNDSKQHSNILYCCRQMHYVVQIALVITLLLYAL